MKNSILFLVILVFAGCFSVDNNDDNASKEVKISFGRWSTKTVAVFRGTAGGIIGTNIMIGLITEKSKTIHGTTYDEFKVGNGTNVVSELGSSTIKGTTVWGSVTSAYDTITVAGIKDDAFISSVLGISDLDGVDLILDTPAKLVVTPPLNVPQLLNVTGSANVGGVAKTCSLSVTYTRDAEDVSIKTKMGTVAGCSHFTTSGKATGSLIPAVQSFLSTMPGEAWYHPDFGLVAYKVPLLGISIGLAEQTEIGNTVGWNVLKKSAVLDSGNLEFTLYTYDRAKQIDADKNTHAKMLLELRWADSLDALTKAQPHYLLTKIVFGTVWGEFRSELIESPVSIFHPEENGMGFKYWYAYVDQAAKNETTEATAYKITVDKDGSLAPLRATARIGYNLLFE